MEPPTFLVAKKRLDSEALFIIATCLVPRSQVAHQVHGLFVSLGPTTNRCYRTIGRGCHPDVLERHHSTGFDTGPHHIEAKAVAFELRRGVMGRTADIRPAQPIQGPLQLGAIKLAIAQKHHVSTQRKQGVDLLHQLEMQGGAEMALFALSNQPANRQGAAFIYHMDHQGDTSAPYHAAIDHQHECLQGEACQQRLGVGEKVHLLIDGLIAHPARVAFDAALGFGTIGHLGGNGRQVTAAAGDDATDEGRQSGQVLGHATVAAVRVPLSERAVYGTILAKIVTHRMRLLV
jgi:hypothetical protein